jgi:hypothetical protein
MMIRTLHHMQSTYPGGRDHMVHIQNYFSITTEWRFSSKYKLMKKWVVEND